MSMTGAGNCGDGDDGGGGGGPTKDSMIAACNAGPLRGLWPLLHIVVVLLLIIIGYVVARHKVPWQQLTFLEGG